MKPTKVADKLALQSMYLSQPVLLAHGISLNLGEELNGTRSGALYLDPNWCGLDGWGDRMGCTKMAVREVNVSVTRMRTYDPTGHRRVLHVVHCPEFEHQEVSLIEYPDAHLWYLIHRRKDAGTFVVPLFPADLMTASSGGIISARYGVAIRAVLERGDVEEMRAEAELVRRTLDDLDGKARVAAAPVDAAKVKEIREALAELEGSLAKLGG